MLLIMWADRDDIAGTDSLDKLEKLGEVITDSDDDDALKKLMDLFMTQVNPMNEGYVYFFDGEYGDDGSFNSHRHVVRPVGLETNVVASLDHTSKILEA
jgi:hypothetical protein